MSAEEQQMTDATVEGEASAEGEVAGTTFDANVTTCLSTDTACQEAEAER